MTVIVFGFVALSLVYGLVSLVKRSDVPVSTIAQQSVGVAQYLIIFVVAFNFAQSEAFVRMFIVALICVAGVVGFVAVLQLLRYQPSLELGTMLTGNPKITNPPAWKVPRGTGVFASWHALGGYLALTLIVGISYVTSPVPSVRRDRWLWLPLCGVAAGLLASLTFIVVAIGFIGVAAVAVYRKLAVKLLLGAVVGASVLLVSPLGSGFTRRAAEQQDDSALPETIAYRVDAWVRDFIPAISENLWTGYGPTLPSDAMFPYYESMYIETLMRGGIPLTVCLLILGWAVLNAAIAGVRKEPATVRGAIVAPATVVILPLLFCGMLIHPYLSDAGVSQLFFILIACCAVASNRGSTRQDHHRAAGARDKYALHDRRISPPSGYVWDPDNSGTERRGPSLGSAPHEGS